MVESSHGTAQCAILLIIIDHTLEFLEVFFNGPNQISGLKPDFCVAGPRKINIFEKYMYLL
jgi:hypothetical protein